ncbi:MAG TPA: alpha/beta hydrolase-fold protein [Steroidobacteraceae bacterium]|nr:alpha/beta hydrolase-fold protein [Steroidobacteraceae bacterium]
MSLKHAVWVIVGLLAAGQTWARTPGGPPPQGTLIDEPFVSTVLRDNRIGLNPERAIKVFLPPGYAKSARRYPVVYFLHNTWWSPRQMFEDGNMQRLLGRGFADGVVKEFILVAADYTGPTTGSLYENSPVSGRWLDYTVDEVVPLIDRKYRTLAQRESRAVVGDFFGGRGALKLAMVKADVFSVAYAMHPVASGTGDIPWSSVEIDWQRMHAAKSFGELGGLGRTQIFWAIHQAFAPNPTMPPCFCEFYTEMKEGKAVYNPDRAMAMQEAFLLDESLAKSAAALRTMRGLALDWGRFDTTQAHVISNRQFSRKLEDLGVEHEAEEYRGDPWNRTWTEDGRFAKRVLPFLEKHLVGTD